MRLNPSWSIAPRFSLQENVALPHVITAVSIFFGPACAADPDIIAVDE
jgi:hypothetical protein